MRARLELEHDGVTRIYSAEFEGLDVETDVIDINSWQSLYPVHQLVTGLATTLRFKGRLELEVEYEL